MASAWGKSFGIAWGNSWGVVSPGRQVNVSTVYQAQVPQARNQQCLLRQDDEAVIQAIVRFVSQQEVF